VDASATPDRPARRPDTGLGRGRRLTRTVWFDEAYAQGRRQVGRYVVLWTREGTGASLRLGVVASRKVGGAVLRNRAKRRLRELFRLDRHRLSGKVDVVLVARRGADAVAFAALRDDFRAVAARAGLWPRAARTGGDS
jgi:ribonuclease P protein component